MLILSGQRSRHRQPQASCTKAQPTSDSTGLGLRRSTKPSWLGYGGQTFEGCVMRAIFTCILGMGHLHPLVPIASEMQRAGHEVAFATPAPLVATVEQCGFRAFAAGMPQTAVEAFPEFRGLRGHAETLMMSGKIRPIQAAVMARDLVNIFSEWRPDILIRETSELGGCIAAERSGIPYAVVEVVATGLDEERRLLLAKGLASVLAEHGLPPDPNLSILDRQAVVSPFPPSYRRRDPVLADTPWLAIRPTPFDQSGVEHVPPQWIDELTAQPIAYFTLGTTALNVRPRVFRTFIEALADEPVNVIIAVGRNNDPADFGQIPLNMRIERYIPQTLVLPRCQLVINHAGSGTVMAALTQGLPLVLIPAGADQPQNARRCAGLGLAKILDEDALDPTTAREAVLEVLSNPAYRQNAKRLRSEIEEMPGPEKAVSLFEELISSEHRS